MIGCFTAIFAGLLTVSMIATTASAGRNTCLIGTAPEVADDAARITALRVNIDLSCPCDLFDGATDGRKRPDYERCFEPLIGDAVLSGQIRKQCEVTVGQIYDGSTCGRSPVSSGGFQPCIELTETKESVACAIRPVDSCTSKPGKYTRTVCESFDFCIDAADANDDLLITPDDSGECAIPCIAGEVCDTELLGVCANGVTTCPDGIAGLPVCESIAAPSAEICDGLDNDCDGSDDDGIADLVSGTNVGECQSEIQSCIDGAFVVAQPGIGPAREICDGLDNDCDVQIDNMCAVTPPTLDPHQKTTTEFTITLTGLAAHAAFVEVSAPEDVGIVDASDGTFEAEVPLHPNAVNDIFLVSIAEDGTRSATTMTSVIQDTEAPKLFIDFPINEAELTTDVTDVAGRVSDVLSGFMGLEVTVNGVPAIVNVGVGTNGTFFAESVPLDTSQPTVIEAVATDELGNSASQQITVEFVEIPPDAPRMAVVSGNAQTGGVGEVLSDPIVVRVSHGDGSPFAGKIVSFDVARSDALLSEEADGEGDQMLQVRTDPAGEAAAFWRLGSDSGCGNNRVEVTSTSIAGTTFFCASASAVVATQLNIGSGQNQRIDAGATAEPLVVWVNDGRNGVPGVPVTFSVVQGGGNVEGFAQLVVESGLTGHASVQFVSGLDGGNNVVEATFPGNTGPPAAFTVFGILRDPAMQSRFTGLVIDNASRPIGGAECVLAINGAPLAPTTTDAEGQFSFTDVPAGPARLSIDGLVANLLDGVSIPLGSFPALSYDTVIVPNATNSLSTPVQLPMLNPANAVPFDNTVDVELTVEEIDGLSMLVRAGSMTRADGTIPSPADPAILTLNQVHADDIPMPIPDGASPPFAWTLQPAGAHFDPPIEITYPNMSGLAPGAIAYFLSFNHDTGKFEIVSTGSVTEDGAFIVSDAGGGLSVSGWGANCPPYAVIGEVESCEAPLGAGGGGTVSTLSAQFVVADWCPFITCSDGSIQPSETSCCGEDAVTEFWTDEVNITGGVIACCGGTLIKCINPKLSKESLGDLAFLSCVDAHEQFHLDEGHVSCQESFGCETHTKTQQLGMKPDNECAAYGKEIECLETICGNLCIDPLTGDPDPTCGACFFSCPKCAVNCTTCSSEAGAIIPFVKNAANKEKPGCYPLCGDEVISGDEQCDDGNLSNGDGCDMICSVESGWTCNGEPSICTK